MLAFLTFPSIIIDRQLGRGETVVVEASEKCTHALLSEAVIHPTICCQQVLIAVLVSASFRLPVLPLCHA